MAAVSEVSPGHIAASEPGVVVGPARIALGAASVATGATALILQITWQRVIALHAGVDLSSATTVVAAFLAGLGLGNLVGGRVADRLRPVSALVALVVTNIGIAGFSLASIWLLYDLYQRWASGLASVVASFGFNFAVLLVPTTLMGMSLPLVARAVTGSIDDAGPTVGRFAAVNTLGGAVGAMVGTWYVLGTYGFVATTRFVTAVQLVVTVVLLTIAASSSFDESLRRRIGRVLLGTGLATAGLTAVWYALGRSESVLPWSPVVAAALAVAGAGLVAFGLASFARPSGRGAGGSHLRFALVGLGATLAVLAVAWYVLVREGVVIEWDGGMGRPLLLVALLCVGLAPVVYRGWANSTDGETPADSTMTDVLDSGPQSETGPRDRPTAGRRWASRAWYVAYGAAGAIALGFEQVFFRLTDGVMRSNTYTFGHVLALYLGLLAIGTGLGSLLVRRARDPRRWFLWLQFGVGVTASVALVTFLDVLPAVGLDARFDEWFTSDGLANGIPSGGDLVVFGCLVPLLLMSPVLLMGASFPFVQALVSRDLRVLGQATGRLLFANLVGNVTGALITGFVLIERLGVAGTYVSLCVPLAAAGIGAALLAPQRRARLTQAALALAVLGTSLVALPSNTELWSALNGRPPQILVAEDRSCASALKRSGPTAGQLTLNGASQNGHPFDDFHVLIGLLPALAHPLPERGIAIGFGIGSTSYGMLASDRVADVRSVELCGGNYQIAETLAAEGSPDFVRLRDDPAHHPTVGDGRKFLLTTDERFDVIVPDHSRATSAGAGNLFSREFYELMRSRLTDNGLAVSWIPTYRVQNAIATTFPYAVSLTVESYNESRLFVGSSSPVELDPEVLVRRYDRIADAFREPQRSRLRRFLADLEPECLTDGRTAPDPEPSAENRDLHPRDEYFLDHGGAAEKDAPGACTT